ncbi:hypothetical protein CSW98_09180 [Vibrio sp. HA2012]|uniref:AraC family transcriptional regulator n=1 Tax=Vibrio sp. HA2012 TaxID=1971595 RepID=UPI000C2BC621|nr:AraC family transcriptional regulator [Vibrio sp. HA2012]PJC86377.1 hypothetical protein CSW98_09180 [Vibrio sp. HA2012]
MAHLFLLLTLYWWMAMKKPVFEQLLIPEGRSLNCRLFSGDAFFCPVHVHPEGEIVFISQGKVNYVIGEMKGELSENELLLIGANIPHAFSALRDGQKFTSYYIHSKEHLLHVLQQHLQELNILEGITNWFRRGAVFHLDREESERYKRIFSCTREIRILAFVEFFLSISQKKPRYYLTQGSDFVVDKTGADIIACIRMNKLSPLPLKDIACRMNISVATFTRVFRQLFGMSYVEYLTTIKIEQACNLLVHSSSAITLVALESGFTSLSQFNKKFKEYVGVSPRQYRKEWKILYPEKADADNWDIGTLC